MVLLQQVHWSGSLPHKITRDGNNQNILAQASLLLIPRPFGFPQVPGQDFYPTHLGWMSARRQLSLRRLDALEAVDIV
jgi:hypothetical protein